MHSIFSHLDVYMCTFVYSFNCLFQNEDSANDSSDEIPAQALKSNLPQSDDEEFISAFISQTGII